MKSKDVARIIVRPFVASEKAERLREELNQHTFEVALHANKYQIREAIETLFGVKVVRVNTQVVPGKRIARRQRVGGRGVRRIQVRGRKWKKAIVTLAEGHTIDVAGDF